MALGEFRRRFGLLSSDVNARPGSPVTDERRAVEDMLLTVDVDPASYRVGQSQVSKHFFENTRNSNFQRESRRAIKNSENIINHLWNLHQIIFITRKFVRKFIKYEMSLFEYFGGRIKI